MRAVRFHGFGDENVVGLDDAPIPEPGPGQVRVRVAGATVNRTDINARAGLYGLPEPGPEGYGLGMDLSGTVDAVGGDVSTVSVGEDVVGFDTDPQGHGAQAEYVVVPAESVVRAPRGFDLVQAAALPLNGLTAVQGFAAIGKAAGTVVVTGAAGGLGQLAVQIGRDAGYRVVALVRDDTDVDFVTRLGAAQVATSIDQIAPRSAVAVIDAAMLAEQTIELIEDGGTFVTFRGSEPALSRGVRHVAIMVQSNQAQLQELVTSVEGGRLDLPDVERVPLDDVAAAQRRFDNGGVRARLVLVP